MDPNEPFQASWTIKCGSNVPFLALTCPQHMQL